MHAQYGVIFRRRMLLKKSPSSINLLLPNPRSSQTVAGRNGTFVRIWRFAYQGRRKSCPIAGAPATAAQSEICFRPDSNRNVRIPLSINEHRTIIRPRPPRWRLSRQIRMPLRWILPKSIRTTASVRTCSSLAPPRSQSFPDAHRTVLTKPISSLCLHL